MSKKNAKFRSTSHGQFTFQEKNRIVVQIGKAIKMRRGQLSFTQAELSEKMGFSRTYLGAIERGERNISLITLINIARHLDVTIVDLISFGI